MKFREKVAQQMRMEKSKVSWAHWQSGIASALGVTFEGFAKSGRIWVPAEIIT